MAIHEENCTSERCICADNGESRTFKKDFRKGLRLTDGQRIYTLLGQYDELGTNNKLWRVTWPRKKRRDGNCLMYENQLRLMKLVK